jgi:hypothetical protein
MRDVQKECSPIDDKWRELALKKPREIRRIMLTGKCGCEVFL